jgi:hypothetical protein
MEGEMAELTRRYVVMAMAAEGPFDTADPEAPFVLKPWKDPAALHALEAYASRCYPELAREIEAWIRVIRSGPKRRGGIGTRNEPYAETAAARKPTRPKARSKARPTKPVKRKKKRGR